MENRIIKSKSDLKEYLECELPLYKTKETLVLRWIKELFTIGESAILRRHIILLRKCEYYTNSKKRIRAMLYKLRLSRIQNLYAIHIPLNTCGKGLRIMHVGPILLNSRVRINENCKLHINTALVAGGTNDEVPTLGNGVVVGVGAVVLGGVCIADNIAIGANSVVNKSFYEENIAIAGAPAKKISDNGALMWNRKVSSSSMATL